MVHIDDFGTEIEIDDKKIRIFWGPCSDFEKFRGINYEPCEYDKLGFVRVSLRRDLATPNSLENELAQGAYKLYSDLDAIVDISTIPCLNHTFIQGYAVKVSPRKKITS